MPDLRIAAADDITNASESPRSFGRQLVYDTAYVFTAPTRWDSADWTQFGIVSAAIVGAGALLDKRERDAAADKTNSLDELSAKAERFGADYSALVLGGFYAGGKLLDSPRAAAVGEDGLAASVIASGLVTPLIKWSVGRVRPADTDSATEFHPFGHDHSFPSGHTTQAFTVASVISAHYDAFWIDAVSYTTAGLVGYARHEHQAHWPSDILGGAAIGVAVGHTVVSLNAENRGAGIRIVPSARGPIAALVVAWQ